jgi:hypothetical protein
MYIQRNESNVIVGVYANPQPGFAEEELPDNHADVVAFLNPPAPKPKVVTMRQARLALLARGLLDDVTTVINSLPSPQKEAATIEWEYSAEVHKDKALVQSLAPALGLTLADLDDLFEEAILL